MENIESPIEPILNLNREYYSTETSDIQVEVVPFYVSERSDPSNNQYFYAYTIRITNNSERSCKIIHRHWKIKDGNGKVFEVQGSGVIGEQPMIPPGDYYEYTSFCPLHSPFGNMRGKYQMIDEFGNRFWIEVPLFFFRQPETFIQ